MCRRPESVCVVCRWMSELTQTKGNDLFRYKGVIAVRGMERKYVFQGVHMLFRGEFAKGLAPWKDGETRECRFVFIGRNLDKDGLIRRFMECKAPDQLRFKVGETVQARCRGRWIRGVVTQHWEDGFPYIIRLLEDGSEVCGPEDNDTFVRASRRWLSAPVHSSISASALATRSPVRLATHPLVP